jgi:hypothetical protein
MTRVELEIAGISFGKFENFCAGVICTIGAIGIYYMTFIVYSTVSFSLRSLTRRSQFSNVPLYISLSTNLSAVIPILQNSIMAT